MTDRQPPPGVHEGFAENVSAPNPQPHDAAKPAQSPHAGLTESRGSVAARLNRETVRSIPPADTYPKEVDQNDLLHPELIIATPSPESHVMPTGSPWQWWAGSSEEWCTIGPEDTREAIIQAATNDSLGEFENEEGGWNLGFYIVEARQDPLRLADWIESDRLLERAEDSMADSDRTSSEYDDGPWFSCTPEQEKDLEERVKRACDEWQAAHKLTFSCPTFSHTRNQEHIIVELPDDRATTEGSADANS